METMGYSTGIRCLAEKAGKAVKEIVDEQIFSPTCLSSALVAGSVWDAAHGIPETP